jgi:hypothetical protein
MTDIACYVQPKNSLARETKKQQLLVEILGKLEKISCVVAKKNDLEFILLVCNIVENVVVKKDRINKKEFVMDIFSMMYNNELTEPDKQTINSHIEFLWENKKIEKIDILTKTAALVGSWFKRKIL